LLVIEDEGLTRPYHEPVLTTAVYKLYLPCTKLMYRMFQNVATFHYHSALKTLHGLY